MMTLEKLRTERKEDIDRLARKHGARSLRVFGSVARGDNKPDSDIDIPAEFEPSRSLFDLIGLRLDLSELLGSQIDIVTPASLTSLRERVLAEAQPI